MSFGEYTPDEAEFESDTDPDLICAILANGGATQDEIDRVAPVGCARHWLSEKEYQRRLTLGLDTGYDG